MTRPAAPPPPDLSERPRADLDALAALLAAAKAAKGDGRWRDENSKANAQMDYFAAVHDPDTIIALIEAARREAGLREALTVLVECVTALENRAIRSGGEFRVWIEERMVTEARDAARSLLHDNAGATEPADSE